MNTAKGIKNLFIPRDQRRRPRWDAPPSSGGAVWAGDGGWWWGERRVRRRRRRRCVRYG